MSKAEEEAIKRFPKIGLYDNLMKRKGFIEGYHQAEKDLELTWKDLATIEKLGDDFIKQNHTPMSDEEFYQEILKRYKDYKERIELCPNKRNLQ